MKEVSVINFKGTAGKRQIKDKISRDAISEEKTATGNPIVITDALPVPAKSLITEINAIQDLHGYDKPWVGGAYKNKLPMTVSAIKAANTSGTWSGNVYTINGGTITILTDSDGNVTGFKVNGTFNDAVNFYVTPTNMSLESNGMIYSGITSGSGSTYFLYFDGAGVEVQTSEVTITTGRNPITMARIVIRSGAVLNNVLFYPMVRPSTESDASFAPYSNICPISGRDSVVLTRSDGDEISEDFTIQLGTTVYGGSLNVTTGVLTVTYAIVDMGDLTWVYDTEVGRFITEDINSTIKIPVDQFTILSAISSAYRATSFVNLYNQHIDGTFASSSGGNVSIINKRYTDITAFTTAMTGQKICYELATPTTIQLTPTQLEMLKGYNRVSIEDGTMNLTYWADRIQALETALAQLMNS